jgi:hypothetical protein
VTEATAPKSIMESVQQQANHQYSTSLRTMKVKEKTKNIPILTLPIVSMISLNKQAIVTVTAMALSTWYQQKRLFLFTPSLQIVPLRNSTQLHHNNAEEPTILLIMLKHSLLTIPTTKKLVLHAKISSKSTRFAHCGCASAVALNLLCIARHTSIQRQSVCPNPMSTTLLHNHLHPFHNNNTSTIKCFLA